MTAPAATRLASVPKTAAATTKVKKKPAYITWEAFQRKYLAREDGHTYEWANGKVDKNLNSMDITQLYIWDNLDTFFKSLSLQKALSGKLMAEVDILLSAITHRRPDVAFFTKEQIRNGRNDQIQVPAFVAEIISPNDSANRVSRKTQEYFAAGVQVVWNIYPSLQEVHVYESPSAARICRGDETCSAEKAIPGFALPVSAILKIDA
ncbi:MAG: Uma2 family endonuclease [Saprospiraceae bacterium]